MTDYMQYEMTDSVASYTKPTLGNRIKKGSVVLVQEKYPCRVVQVDIAKTGKHGSAKAVFTGLDIFTGKKHEELTTTHSKVPEVIVERHEYVLIDITDEGYLSLMREDGEIRSDLTLPPADLYKDARGRIVTLFENDKECKVVVMQAMGQEMAIDAKQA